MSFRQSSEAKRIKAAVARRGLCGDVFLTSTPSEDRIEEVKIDRRVGGAALVVVHKPMADCPAGTGVQEAPPQADESERDETAALSAETDARAQAGKLTTEEMIQALGAQAQTWQKFKDARDGRADDDAR